MLNLKSAVAFVLLTTATYASANEIVIDTVELHASIKAELAQEMAQIQLNLTQDLNRVLLAHKQDIDTEMQPPASVSLAE